MTRIFLLHWNQSEAEERAALLRRAGHEVTVHWSTESSPQLKEALPEVAVISLDRLPSHGRAVAEWLWEAKKRRLIPILFAGGEPPSIEATRAKFPKALFCSTASIVGAIAKRTALRSSRSAPLDSALSRSSGAGDAVRPSKSQLAGRARSRAGSMRSRSTRG